jgi:hypothetical protein
MEIFEYVAVLTSIVIGLGITHLLQGVARIIQHPGMEYMVTTPLQFGLLCVAAVTREEAFHRFLGVGILAYQMSWGLRFFETVG